MSRKDQTKDLKDKKTEPRPEQKDAPERTAAPPIEREHETYAGILEEDEQRKDDERR